MVFLDKTCIHQTNKDIQRLGIEKLGAFLCKSSRMVVCYTDLYLKKLWTVYEVASFLTLHGPSQMSVISTEVPVVLCVGMGSMYLTVLIGTMVEAYTGFSYSIIMVACCLMYCLMAYFRMWSRNRATTYAQLATFSVQSCWCTNEEDRPFVYRNIAELCRATQLVAEDASEEEALAAFDLLVRTELLSNAFSGMLGGIGLQYSHLLLMTFCSLGPYYLDILAGVGHGLSARAALCWVIAGLIISALSSPALLALLLRWAGWRLAWQGCRERLYLLSGLLLGCLAAFVVQVVLELLFGWAIRSNLGLVAFICYALLLALVNVLIFRTLHGIEVEEAPAAAQQHWEKEAKNIFGSIKV